MDAALTPVPAGRFAVRGYAPFVPRQTMSAETHVVLHPCCAAAIRAWTHRPTKNTVAPATTNARTVICVVGGRVFPNRTPTVESVVEAVKPVNRAAPANVWISKVTHNIAVPVVLHALVGRLAVTRLASASKVTPNIAVRAAKRVSLVNPVAGAAASSRWLQTPNIAVHAALFVGSIRPRVVLVVVWHLFPATLNIAALAGMFAVPANLVVRVAAPTWPRTPTTAGLVAKPALRANFAAKGVATLPFVPE